MLSRKQKYIFLKLFSLFSVVRGYNIIVVVIAQYLSSIFIFAPHIAPKYVLNNINVLLLVLASAMAIAGGYIINNFYDSEKDLINRPNKSMLDRLVSQNTKLSIYFVLNFLAIILVSYVSFRAVLFFAGYIFGIWFYSHKLKKRPIVGNLTSAILSVTPLFALFIYYKNFDTVVFMHALFLFLLISMRELTKDLENIKGDLALNYRTIPVVYGEILSKKMLSFIIIVTIVIANVMAYHFDLGRMHYFFYATAIVLFIFLILIWNGSSKPHYVILHIILKFIIVSGVISLILIDTSRIYINSCTAYNQTTSNTNFNTDFHHIL